MEVEEDQPGLLADLGRFFADPALVAATGTTARTVDGGHGRIERRQLWTSTALGGDRDRPGLAQAVCIARTVVAEATGEIRRERADAVTSLGPARAWRRRGGGWGGGTGRSRTGGTGCAT